MKIKHKLTILATALLLAACGGETSAPTPPTKTETPASTPVTVNDTVASAPAANPNAPTLRVMTDDTYPPFASKGKNSQIEGLDVDLFTAVAKDQGMNVQFLPHAWEGIFKRLADDSADVIVSAVGITEESLASADLSEPYYVTPYRVAKLSSSSNVDLKNWATQPKIAISSSEDAAVDLPERYQVKKEQLLEKESVFLAIQEVAKGNAQVVVADSTVLQYYMGSSTFKDHKIEFTSENLTVGQGSHLVFAVKKGNKELLDKLNKGLANVKASGEYEQILKKWNQTVPEGMVLPKK